MKEKQLKISDYGITDTQIKNLLDEDQYEAFQEFMAGQTMALIENETVYYYTDIRQFLKYKKAGNVPAVLWD